MSKTIRPFGSWKSPVTSDLVASETVTLDAVRLHGDAVFWLERRPAEAGRSVIVRLEDNQKTDIIPAPYNARSRVHEYGGGVYCTSEQGLYFVNDADQDIYRAGHGASPERITRTGKELRYADLELDRGHRRIFCVCEDHSGTGTEPVNCLVSVDLATGAAVTLLQGYDFYSSPRVSPDGTKFAWLCWNHPGMPWDGTELWQADIDRQGRLQNPVHVCGDAGTSVFQPEWSPDDVLYFVTDESGWWNLARLDPAGITRVTDLKSEFGLPQWVFGQSTYAFSDSNTLHCAHITDGTGRLSVLDTRTLALTDVPVEYNAFASVCAGARQVCCIAASETRFPEVIRLDKTGPEPEVLASSCNIEIDQRYVSTGRHCSFDTRHNDKVHAIYYPPVNRDFDAPRNERPPLIVLSHGGPTGAVDASLDLRKQYWTSRGFAMLDVNYSGSTGYGRAYKERLKSRWGVRDVEDLCDAALHFADQGLADRSRLIIKGSSAGGYSVLCALSFHDIFSCGASYYGISDLESLLADTHKFESHYTDALVGPYPETRQVYHDRSPIHYVDRLSCPVIFFQGVEDRVVPPSQAEKMVSALKLKGIPVSYVRFENEQHGFRQASTIRTALDSELYFYAVILGFDAADELTPVHIDNLDAQ
jgi:dipeptidyl aminopeptidase/acylaminoacyl peptidase